MKTILITGVSGFLGSHLVKAFYKSNKIIGVIRKDSNLWRLKDYDIELVDSKDLNHIEKKIDFIIHTATNYGRNGNKLSEIIDSNLLFGIQVLEFANDKNIKTFININTLQNPMTNPYCMSKNHLSNYFRYFDNINIIDVCIEHMYGPFDDNNKFIHYLIEQMILNNNIKLSKGEQLRDFIYIDDVINAFKIIINNIDSFKKYTRCELGSGKQTRLKDFIELTLDIFNQYSNTNSKLLFGEKPYNPLENMNIKTDISLLQSFGYIPKYSNKDGITKTIAYHLNRGGVAHSPILALSLFLNNSTFTSNYSYLIHSAQRLSA